MLCSLIAYDDDYNVVATLDHLVKYDEAGNPLGLVRFADHESDLTQVWRVESVTLDETGNEVRTSVRGSKTWPEWLGSQAHAFRAEVVGPEGAKRLVALVHKVSGHRRVRADIEAAIAQRIAAAHGGPADIRDIVGGPDRPLTLDEVGQTVTRPSQPRPELPVITRGKGDRE